MANHRQPVPEWLNEPYMETILRNHFKDFHLKVSKVIVNPGSSEGDNFLGQIFRISVDYESMAGKPENISVIGKLKTDSIMSDDFTENVDVFQVEYNFFSNLVTQINKIVKRKGGKIFSPRGIHVEKEKGIILMEDLKSSDYELQSRGELLNLKQAELLVEALANLHGASLHAIQEDPKLVNVYKGHVFSSKRTPGLEVILDNATRALADNISKYNISDAWQKRLARLKDRMSEDWFKIYEKQDGGFNVLSHGDCWLNNMMFHYSEGQPDRIMLIDYQLVNYSSFANDLMHGIFSSVQSEVILTKIDYLLELYHSKLVAIAPNVPEITLERIQSEFEGKYYFGYLVMLLIRTMILSETPPDFDLIIKGEKNDLGFASAQFISDLEKLLPFFEKKNVW